MPLPVAQISGGNSGFVVWTAWDRPNAAVEIGFQAVAGRDSKDIHHTLEVGVSCTSADKAVFTVPRFVTSDFPSHKLWINGQEVKHDVQGPFESLWRSELPKGRPYVTIDGMGPFQWQ